MRPVLLEHASTQRVLQVPMDQGKHSLAMLEQWTRGKKFGAHAGGAGVAGLPDIEQQLSSI